ncbi:MAG: hypothetical protein ACYCQH_04630 [Acidithiobacillus ferrooxidans]|jgi:uncharacterized protein (UPF0332 family)|uniref:HEPN domain-containing protein n=1 Tax=mine drainage metagenome TaxID=410659 RepID=E6QC34_9ZZZZ
MPVNAEDFLFFAEQLNPESEQARRTAVSRAYYALYHAAVNLKDTLALQPPPNMDRLGMHKRLTQTFRTSDEQGLRDMGDDLEKARKKRVRADYDLDDTIGLPECQKDLRFCRRVYKSMKLHPLNP